MGIILASVEPMRLNENRDLALSGPCVAFNFHFDDIDPFLFTSAALESTFNIFNKRRRYHVALGNWMGLYPLVVSAGNRA